MTSKLISAVFLSSALILSSCGKKEAEPTLKPLSQNNPIITGAEIVPSATQKLNFKELSNNPRSVYQITLKDDALKQTFLLSVAGISAAPTPTGRAMANKIVFFEKKDGSLFMFESLNGKLSTDSVKTRVLLAEFPITRETNGSVTFDFKKGMKLLFQKRSVFTSDLVSTDAGDTVFKITDSYINSVEIRGKYIFIDQIVRVDSPATATTPARNESLQLKYTLSTYKKNPNFRSKKTNSQKRVGYFEAHPVLEAGSGKSTTNIMKFDITKPIVFHVSNNVPAEYIEAVNDGILYWNKAFGKEVLKVATLPEGISVHEPNYNIFQWLHWDTAGSAYANMMGDPLTGETLQSHVYMTSVFGKGGLRNAKRTLRKYEALAKTKMASARAFLRPAGFESAHVCEFNYNKSMADLTQIIQSTEEAAAADGESTDEEKEAIFLRYSQDYVREVAAHEIGHTLGIRHNFAGSLKTNITPKLYDTVAKIYFLTGELLPGMIPAGTVMDYTPSMIASMLGAHIRLNRPSLSYDKQAIDFGYTDKSANEIEFDTFCTDSHRGKGIYQDCKVFDQFSNPIDGAVFDMNNAIPSKAFSLASKFSFLDPSFKSEEAGEEASEFSKLTNLEKIAKIRLDPRAGAQKLVKSKYAPLLAMTTAKAEFMSIRKKFDTIGSLEEADYKKETNDFMTKSVTKVGGLSKLFISPLTPVPHNDSVAVKFASDLATKFQALVSKLYKDATTEELDALNEKMALYFGIFEKEAALAMITALSKHKFTFKEANFGADLHAAMDSVLFTESEKVIGLTASGSALKEYLFQFKSNKSDLRGSAAKLVQNDFFPFSPSYMRGQKKLVELLKKKHADVVSLILTETTEAELSDELYDWLFFEKARLNFKN